MKMQKKEKEKQSTEKQSTEKQSTEKQSAEKPNTENEGKRHRLREWGEILYNCPYLVTVIATSVVVMLCSEEIGYQAVISEARTVIEATVVEGDMSGQLLFGHSQKTHAGTEGSRENTDNSDDIKTENEGECKEENTGDSHRENGKEDKNILDTNNKASADADGENIAYAVNSGNDAEDVSRNAEDKPAKGVTRFKIYAPQKIDSYYYSDAGKVALTTEYPYRKENASYFYDAAFLGDSRTLGISDYAGLDEADFYCDSGMTIYKILEPDGVTYQKTGSKVDLSRVFTEKRYGKIYIMLGMNELGYGNTSMYLEQYRKVVEQIREWQPGAIIYIMANLHVSREKNNTETEFNNININDKNAAAAQLANGSDIFYLDANPLFTDAEGFLNSELTFDGVHLYAKHYEAWKEFLMEHAVEPEAEQDEEPEQDAAAVNAAAANTVE